MPNIAKRRQSIADASCVWYTSRAGQLRDKGKSRDYEPDGLHHRDRCEVVHGAWFAGIKPTGAAMDQERPAIRTVVGKRVHYDRGRPHGISLITCDTKGDQVSKAPCTSTTALLGPWH